MISIPKIMITKISDLESTKIINIPEREVILQDWWFLENKEKFSSESHYSKIMIIANQTNNIPL